MESFWQGFEKSASDNFQTEKPLYKPRPSTRAGKKYMVYVKAPGGGKRLIHFGAKGYQHNYSEGAKKNFRARHNCDSAQKDSAKWWACNYLWNKKQKVGTSTYEKAAAPEWIKKLKGLGIPVNVKHDLGPEAAQAVKKLTPQNLFLGSLLAGSGAGIGYHGSKRLIQKDNEKAASLAGVGKGLVEGLMGVGELSAESIARRLARGARRTVAPATTGTGAAYVATKNKNGGKPAEQEKAAAQDPYSEKRRDDRRPLSPHLAKIKRNRIEPNKPPKPPRVNPTTGPNYG